MPKELAIHSARHTIAVALLRKTGNLRQVQKQLGHASPATTANMYADINTPLYEVRKQFFGHDLGQFSLLLGFLYGFRIRTQASRRSKEVYTTAGGCARVERGERHDKA